MKTEICGNEKTGHRPGCYRKLKEFGAECLSDSELLAILLQTGDGERSAEYLAEEVLIRYGEHGAGLDRLRRTSIAELCSIKGIGPVKALRILAALELGMRMCTVRRSEKDPFDSPQKVADLFSVRLSHLQVEELRVLCLDSRLRLIQGKMISRGSINTSLVPIREICETALKCSATSVLILHNHPSGDPMPSREDLEVTERIRSALAVMEILLTDHIIFGDHCYYSLREHGKGNWNQTGRYCEVTDRP